MFRKFAVRLLIAIPVVTLSWTSVTAVELRTVPLLNLHESTPFPLPSEIALTYVSETKRIPEGELQVAGEESFVFPTLRRTFTNISVVHSTTEILRTYYVLIDSETGTITEDLDGLRQAEAEAYHAKYGKLQPSL